MFLHEVFCVTVVLNPMKRVAVNVLPRLNNIVNNWISHSKPGLLSHSKCASPSNYKGRKGREKGKSFELKKRFLKKKKKKRERVKRKRKVNLELSSFVLEKSSPLISSPPLVNISSYFYNSLSSYMWLTVGTSHERRSLKSVV